MDQKKGIPSDKLKQHQEQPMYGMAAIMLRERIPFAPVMQNRKEGKR
jgi:hypothetical protein